MKQIIIFLFSLNFLLISCASNKFEPFDNIKNETLLFPPQGTTATVKKNQNILFDMKFKRGAAVYIPKTVSPVKKGYYFATGKKTVRDSEGSEYVIYQFTKQGLPIRKYLLTDEVDDALQYDTRKKELRYGEQDGASGFYPRNKITSFSFSEKMTPLFEDSFHQTLQYCGKKGNTIKLVYNEHFYSREIKTYTYQFGYYWAKIQSLPDNRDDSSYKEEITHDLSKSDIISYKNARIQVISVTDKEIKYKVLQGF